MKITTARRISQCFFLILFLWFCIVTTLGESWWQLRGWPVNLFLQLDPLVCLGTLLTTYSIFRGLLWGVLTICLTILLGRFFCGWLCPLGTINQFVGYLGRRKKSALQKTAANRYRAGQSVKYWILTVILTAALWDLVVSGSRRLSKHPAAFGILILAILLGLVFLALRRITSQPKRAIGAGLVIAGVGFLISVVFSDSRLLSASLQTGLLDPLPLLYRSLNLVLLPFADGSGIKIFSSPRFYDGVWLIGLIFLAVVLLNLKTPRFYCRFICPLGALLGVMGRYSIWRMGKSRPDCPLKCHLCQTNCEGACQPSEKIRTGECVLCFNCYDDCATGLLSFRLSPSASGEIRSPDVTRRALVVSIASGAALIPTMRLNGALASNWNPGLIRPPGALSEKEFLTRCIKCGQCMRICPTNVIHPDFFKSGIEGFWTPALDFRIGTSGCQINCIACGNICPTAAIRPISLDERRGIEAYSARGPLKIGTAFVDRGRCLPWAMDKPCIVCQENCPVSPKAIFTREHLQVLYRPEELRVKKADTEFIELEGGVLEPERYAGGDFYCKVPGQTDSRPRLIVRNDDRSLAIGSQQPWQSPPRPGDRVEILIRLQKPFVDIERCVGCGICEHECPVKGKRAIRVTADNESRNRAHALLLAPFPKK